MKKVKIVKKANSGLKVKEGGYSPLSPDTIMLNGKSHKAGGQDISFNGIDVEAEGGESVTVHPDNSATVFGNLYIPGTNKKFKNIAKSLAKKETEALKIATEGLQLLQTSDPTSKWGALSFNSGRIMTAGGSMKHKELSSLKTHLSELQSSLLEMSEEHGLDAPSLSKGVLKRAENGLKINAQNGAKWKYVNTRTGTLDDKIKGFINLIESKGYTGYSGPESGVSQRNTKSGRKSRHASGEALDAFLSSPDAYNTVLKDPELTKYLIDSGLTVIDEYNPSVAKQTGATAGHLHIGYDKGTPISDKFRSDAASLYKSSNPAWGWGTLRNPKGAPIKGGLSGDAQFNFTPEPFTPTPFTSVSTTPKTSVNARYPGTFSFSEKSRNIPSNAEPLELSQVLPELYSAATNKVEPVHLQQYTPELYSPYSVSFQDRLNKNQSSFNAISDYTQDNPSALSTLAGQKYEADNQVLAEEFRTNQAIANEITNKNTALLNEAEQKNLQLADLQYVRQSQAKSTTKAQNNTILNSISNKMLQREKDNRTLQIYENLYDYRFDSETGQAEYKGVPGYQLLNFPEATSTNPTTSPIIPAQTTSDQSVSQRYDKSGKLIHSTISTPSPIQSLKNRISVNRQFNLGKPKTIADIYNRQFLGAY